MPRESDGRLERSESEAAREATPSAQRGARHDFVDQPPPHGFFPTNAFGPSGEVIGEIAAHVAFVHHARQAASARQNGQQRQLRQRHCRRAIVHQHDVLTCEGELVSATRSGPVQRGQVDLPRGIGRVLDAVAGLVGELTEIHLGGVRCAGEHADVGAGAEDPLLAAGEDDDANLGVFETQPLHGVIELDVDAEVIGVELQLVARQRDRRVRRRP